MRQKNGNNSKKETKSREEGIVVQPYRITNGSYHWSPLMCNMVGVIIYHVCTPADMKNEEVFGVYTRDEFLHHVIDMPIKTLLGNNSRNYEAIIKAVRALWKVPVKVRLQDGNTEY